MARNWAEKRHTDARCWRSRLLVGIAIWAILLGAGSGPVRAAAPPDFASEVKPILKNHCVKCHSGTRKKGGFSINTRQSLLAGGDSGEVVVVGNADDSYFLDLLTDEDAAVRMPQEAPPLTPGEIAVLRAWIDGGAPWEPGFAFGQEHRRAPLAPRRVPLAETDARDNPIDQLLAPYFRQHAIAPAEPIGEADFARRVSLDLTGLLPSPQQVSELAAAAAADKRTRFVAGLLDDRRSYADHWISFWNDLLRNAYRGTGFIDEGRSQITQWLYRSLYDNQPYDRFVHELISPVPGSEGFIKGIIWRGTVNDSQRREMQAAQNIAQVFLGTNLKCASCHDSFVNNWKVADAYGLAAVFSDEALEIHRCNRPTGTKATMAFLYPELGEINPLAGRQERMKQLADLVVSPDNGRFARVIVNRLWAQLFGRGLVEPIDDLDAEPWHPDLLDWLACDLVEHQYDLKRTMRLICTSRAYQLPATDALAGADPAHFEFHGPLVKRMTAEQFLDAVFTITGYWPPATQDMLQRDGRKQGGQLADVAGMWGVPGQTVAATKAHWIWPTAEAMTAPAGQRGYFRKWFTMEPSVERAYGVFTADNTLTVFVNGSELGTSDNWMVPLSLDLTAALRPGENEVEVVAVNQGGGRNPAGFICDIGLYDGDGKLVDRIPSNGSWWSSLRMPQGWPAPVRDVTAASPAVEIAAATAAPWAIADRLRPAPPVRLHVRAALFMDDPLNRALGRPNRDQVVTRRESLATSLQAMELTNGQTLDQLLRAGAEQCLQRAASVEDLFTLALGRAPTQQERTAARELAGDPATTDGIADLLWAIVMLPEFQLIR